MCISNKKYFIEDQLDFVEFYSDNKKINSIKINPIEFNKQVKPDKNILNLRQSLTSYMKIILKEGRSIIERNFKKSNQGLFCAASQSHLVDQLIKKIFKTIHENINTSKEISLIATGGYGRGELAPYSDIDILFLISKKKNKSRDQLINFILYILWDLGLSVGHSTRTLDQAIKDSDKDIDFRTSILESRLIIGDISLFKKLKNKFLLLQKKTVSEFIKFKLKEQKERHKSTGGSRYILEPNIKDSKGCIRDLNTLFWILKYRHNLSNNNDIKLYQGPWLSELKKSYKALSFLTTLRCHLHYLSKRNNNILDLHSQEQIALSLNFRNRLNSLPVERLMKRFYLIAKDVGNLTRIFSNELDLFNNSQSIFSIISHKKIWNSPDFELKDGKLYYNSKKIENIKSKINPKDILNIFCFAQNKMLEIHPSTIYKIVISKRELGEIKDKKCLYKIFIKILLSPKKAEEYLGLMSETGILGKLFPDFQRIIGLMQFNTYHYYTVDEHILRSIGFLHKIEKGDLLKLAPIATKTIKKIQSKDVLYIAMFLHDIGKGRKNDHSIEGELLAKKICSQLSLSDEKTENILWLVRNHLLMSKFAFNYDISDPNTIIDFTLLVQSPEKLRLLLILTVADILAVAPGVWNSWKATLLRDLFKHSEEVLYGADPYLLLDLNPEKSKIKIREELFEWGQEDFDYYSSQYPDNYWTSINIETHVWLAKTTRDNLMNKRNFNINFKNLINTDSILIVVMAPDHPGLFSDIAGAITIQGIEIQTAKIFTRKDGIAVDFFWVSPGERVVFEENKLNNIKSSIKKCLTTGFKPEKQIIKLWKSIPKKIRLRKYTSRVIIDNTASPSQTIIEVNGKNRPGLLYNLTKEISSIGLQIQSASVSTYGDSVVDVFYVKDMFGMKVENKRTEKLIKKNINRILIENLENDNEKFDSKSIS